MGSVVNIYKELERLSPLSASVQTHKKGVEETGYCVAVENPTLPFGLGQKGGPIQ
jgi:hypothetical protein